MIEIPDNLPDITRDLIALRKKPSTEERFKSYPALLKQFMALLATCEDKAVLRDVIALDDGYFLPAGYRQQVLEKWLTLERTPELLRLYAMQLMLFGDVDDFGEASTKTEAKIEALNAEAARLE